MPAGISLPTDIAVPTRVSTLVLCCTLLIVLLVGLEQYVERRYLANLAYEQRAQLLERVSTVRYQLESAISSSLSVLNGLAGFIESDINFSADQFDRYARQAISHAPALLNMVAAPKLIISDVYPDEGNEVLLDLDYRDLTDQRDAVFQAVRDRIMTIDGPLELVQGGTGFLGRVPVYTRDETGVESVWGIVASALEIDALYQQSGLYDLPDGMEVAIRNRHRESDVGIFFGSDKVFEHPARVIMPIMAGDTNWQLAAVTADVAPSAAVLWGIRAASAGILALALSLLIIRYRVSENRRALLSAMAHNEQFLTAVETVSRVGGWRCVNDRFTDLSAQARNILRLPDDAHNMNIRDLCRSLEGGSANAIAALFEEARAKYQRISEELELTRTDGSPVWLQIEAEIMGNRHAGIELVGTVQDITQQKQIDQLIEYQAHYDQLTGLPNRQRFHECLAAALSASKAQGSKTAVLFLDLDHFKSVNDNLGHAVGDGLLIEAARRIQSCVRSVDMVGRYSGDEFVAMLTGISSPIVMSEIAEHMIAVMRRPFIISGHHMYCSISLGVALYPEDGMDPDTLIIKADQAMSQVKKSGRNAWQFYTVTMQRESEQRHRLYNELFEAINSQALEVVYQPVVNARSGQVVSCEALVRWRHPDGSWVSPDEFIPLAEERGLVNRIDLFVLKKGLAFIKELNKDRQYPLGLSVNVSPLLLQLRDEDALSWLRLLGQENSVTVTIEVTERVFIEEAVQAQKTLRKLHADGARIAIDDFGTGYSGLSNFSRLPVSVVKIDQSFVRRLQRSHTETSLVETIISLAGKLNIEVVAEGVETREQADFLRREGCDYLQGYYVSRPLSAEKFARFLSEQ